MKKEVKVMIVVLVLVFLVGVIAGIYKSRNTSKDQEIENANDISLEDTKVIENDEEEKKEPEKKINIFQGNDRAIAFMIDNNVNAQPQSSINKAYLVYEIIVEGGESRLMAIFKGVEADKVGPIRSSRHYFLDYAMENDVIYAHLGMSPQAMTQIETFGINNINGQVYDTGKARTTSSLYWRSTERKAPHNAYTNTESILKIAEQKGYRTTSDKESVLNYVPDEVELNTEDAMIANTVIIPYTTSHKVKYVYDESTKRYTRYSKGKVMSDATTSEHITTKNLIITFAKNTTLNDGENKGRQDVETVGNLDGYYITNGKSIKIKCNKTSRESQTSYVDLDGNEIDVNDGNTFINICPIDSKVTIEE